MSTPKHEPVSLPAQIQLLHAITAQLSARNVELELESLARAMPPSAQSELLAAIVRILEDNKKFKLDPSDLARDMGLSKGASDQRFSRYKRFNLGISRRESVDDGNGGKEGGKKKGGKRQAAAPAPGAKMQWQGGAGGEKKYQSQADPALKSPPIKLKTARVKSEIAAVKPKTAPVKKAPKKPSKVVSEDEDDEEERLAFKKWKMANKGAIKSPIQEKARHMRKSSEEERLPSKKRKSAIKEANPYGIKKKARIVEEISEEEDMAEQTEEEEEEQVQSEQEQDDDENEDEDEDENEDEESEDGFQSSVPSGEE